MEEEDEDEVTIMCVLCDWWGGGLWECGLCGRNAPTVGDARLHPHDGEQRVQEVMQIVQSKVPTFLRKEKKPSNSPFSKIMIQKCGNAHGAP